MRQKVSSMNVLFQRFRHASRVFGQKRFVFTHTKKFSFSHSVLWQPFENYA